MSRGSVFECEFLCHSSEQKAQLIVTPSSKSSVLDQLLHSHSSCSPVAVPRSWIRSLWFPYIAYQHSERFTCHDLRLRQVACSSFYSWWKAKYFLTFVQLLLRSAFQSHLGGGIWCIRTRFGAPFTGHLFPLTRYRFRWMAQIVLWNNQVLPQS